MADGAAARPFVLVVAETGAAVFLEPVLKQWLDGAGLGVPWRVIAGPPAGRRLRATFGDRLALEQVDSTDADVGPLIGDAGAVLVSAGRARAMERHAVLHATRAGIACAQFIETWYNFRSRLEWPDGLILPDHLLVIDPVARNQAIAEGLPPELLVVVGQPAWERACHDLPPADPTRVLVLGSPIREMLPGELGYDQRDCWDLVAAAAAQAPNCLKTLAYAPHPEEQWRPAGVPRVTDTLAALGEYGTVVGSFAAPMLDAYLGRRRVVSVQPRLALVDICPLTLQGLVPKVATAGELVAALMAPAGDPEPLRGRLRGSLDRVHAALARMVAGLQLR